MGIAAADVNNSMSSGGNGPEIVFDLTETLIVAGYIVTAESDGSGGAITHSGSGANGYANNNAYRVLSKPTTGAAPFNAALEVGFQRGTSNDSWKMRMFPTAGSSGGTNTLMPTSGDQVHYGDQSNTDTFEFVFETTPISRYHIIVLDSAEGHGFNVMQANNGLTTFSINGTFFMDPVQQGHPDNTCPWVFMADNKSPTAQGEMATDGVWGMAFVEEPQADFRAVNFFALEQSGDQSAFPDGLAQHIPSGDDPAMQCMYADRLGQYKGLSTFFYWPGVNRGMGHEYTDAGQVKAYIRFGILAMRWDEATTMIF